MFWTALIFSALLLLMAVFQIAFPLFFARLLKNRWNGTPAAQKHAAVLLAVRGCDPSLHQSLSQLLEQDYPSYEIQIVIDHKTDPAWDVIQRLGREHPNGDRLRIHEMTSPDPSRGLKCHSMIQAIESVSEETAFVILVDADVTTGPDWLTTVIAPLSDKEIGAVTGNQWFEPDSVSTGALLRSMWNAGAIISTVMYRNPWAGTCAMRLEDVRDSGLIDAWRSSVIDDGPIRDSIVSLGKKIHFEPSLIMINREDCSTGYVSRYITRMLTWSRLYESNFANTLVHATLTMAIITGTIAAFAASIINVNFTTSIISATALIVFCVATMSGYLLVRSACLAAAETGNKGGSLSLYRVVKLIVLAPVIQSLYSLSCFRALIKKTVLWRQIRYRINGKQVTMLSYQPFEKIESGESFSI